MKNRLTLLFALALVALSPTAWGGNTYYAQLTATSADSARGKVYAATSSSEVDSSYGQSDKASAKASQWTLNSSVNMTKLYAFAKAEDGFRFTYWSGNGQTLYSRMINPSLTAKGSQAAPTPFTYTANFEPIVRRELHMCVGDKVTLHYDIAGDTTGKYATYKATGNGNKLQVEAVGEGATSSSQYRGCAVTITAKEAGVQEVRLQKQNGTGGLYGDYDIINVIIDGEREIKRGDSVAAQCGCSEAGKGKTTWTTPTITPSGIATASGLSDANATNVTFTLTGNEPGSVTAKLNNRDGASNTAYKGAEWELALTVLDTPTVDVTMSRGTTMVVPAFYEDGTGSTSYELDKESENNITAALQNLDDRNCTITLIAAANAAAGATARFTVKAGAEMFLAYRVKVVEPLTMMMGDVTNDVAAAVNTDWQVGSSDSSVATIAGTSSGFSRNAKITAVSLGDAVCWATNNYTWTDDNTASVGYYNYAVRVKGSHSQKVYVAANSTVDVTCGLAGTTVAAWTATSGSSTTATVALNTSAAADQVTATITGKKVGTTTVTVSNAYWTETIEVEVLQSLVEVSDQIGIDESREYSQNFGTVSSVTSDNELAATAEMVGGKLVVTGHTDGTAVIRVTGSNLIAIYTILVHQQNIRKTIELAIGTNGGTSYSYTFDQLREGIVAPRDSSVASMSISGNTVTFTAVGAGTTTADIPCVVDGLSDPSCLYYTIKVTRFENRGVWPFKEGYIAYANVTEIAEDADGNLMIGFHDPDTIGEVEIPAPYTAVVDSFLVGGGGAGGSELAFGMGGGGGGAGGVGFAYDRKFNTGTYYVVVGRGGIAEAGKQGGQGGDTFVTNSTGVTTGRVLGGGGGGSSTEFKGDGGYGGSGGGATWSPSSSDPLENLAGTGGPAADGQGAVGAMPSVYNCGAGGGGSGGPGDPTGPGGPRRATGFTGEYRCAAGGAGGRADRNAPGAAGTGMGDGGEGGSGQLGGNGANGGMCVRITDLYRAIKVPVPTTNDLLTLKFLWENNKTCVPFDYVGKTFRSPSNAHPYPWTDAIASVDGNAEVVCTTGAGGTKKGIGYYTFTIRLKDGFVWDSDSDFNSYGSSEDLRFRWNIVETFDDVVADIDLSKYVSWTSESNATITISSRSAPEMTGGEHPAPKSYTLDFSDTVASTAAGLDLASITTFVSTDGVNYTKRAEWTPTGGVQNSGSGVSVALSVSGHKMDLKISGLTIQLWTRTEIKVVDNGVFRTNIGATLNPSTGLYEKNPNDGSAQVIFTNADGQQRVVTCEAETDVPWRYVAHPVEVSAVNGQIFINGTEYNPYALYEGADVTVYYRGQGGYELSEILVDGLPIPVTEANLDHYDLKALASPHTVQVVYNRFYGAVSSEAAEFVYDGQAHVFPVTLTDWSPDYSTQVRYAYPVDSTNFLTAEEFCATYRNTLKNVGTHRIAYRVFAFQPGYGETLTEPGWAWVDTGRQGTSTVTIEPKDLIVAPNYKEIESGKPLPTFGYTNLTDFVEGEGWNDISKTGWGVGTDYDKSDNKDAGLYPTWITGIADPLNGNYYLRLQQSVLAVTRKALQINGVAQIDGLDPENPYINTGVDRVEKIYDGVSVGLTINVTMPTSGCTIKYSMTGYTGKNNWSDTKPMFTDVGTNKVYYLIDPGTSGDNKNYFAASNYQYVVILPRPVTVESGSSTNQYDGTAHSAPQLAVAAESPYGFVNGQGITGKNWATRTEVGESENTFGYDFNSGTKSGNYVITKKYGSLVVTPGQLVIGGKTQPLDPSRPLPQGQTGVEDVEKFYDGEGTNLVVTVTGAANPTVLFTTNRSDAASWKADLSLVEIGEYVVYYAVEAHGYASVTNFGRVIIKAPEIKTLSIVDHLDYGGDEMRLAFRIDMSGKPSREYIEQQITNRIKVVYAHSPEGFDTAIPQPVRLSDTSVTFDPEKIWITIDPDIDGNTEWPLLWKVVIGE